MKNHLDIIQKIEEHLQEPYRLEGYEIVRVQLTGVKSKTLQIMIDRLDGKEIVIEDCVAVSRLTSILLDQIDVIAEAYHLEVSSPGLDRPLTKPHHYIKNVGKLVSLNTQTLIKNRKRFVGLLAAASEDGITLKVDDPLIDGTNEVDLAYHDIRSAKIKL